MNERPTPRTCHGVSTVQIATPENIPAELTGHKWLKFWEMELLILKHCKFFGLQLINPTPYGLTDIFIYSEKT